MQFHWPSGAQGPLRVPGLKPLDDEVGAGAGSEVDEGIGSGTLGVLVPAGAGIEVGAGAAEEVSVGALLGAAEGPGPEPELEEPEPVSPWPSNVGVPVQAGSPLGARLAG